MKRWAIAVAAGLALLALLLVSHWSIARGSLDDVATMYANAWLETCSAADALPRLLQEHLAQHRSALSAESFERYRIRLDILGRNYLLLSSLVRLAARFQLAGLTTVVGAALLGHVVIVTALWAFVQRRQPWVLLALLAGGVASLTLPALEAALYLPFQLKGMTWLCNMPRGAAVLAWFGAMLALLFGEGWRRLLIAGVFALLSLLCHRAMGLLCFACTLPPLGLWLGLRRYASWRVTPLLLVASFLGVVLAVAGAKLALLLHYDSTSLKPLYPAQPASAATARSIFVLISWAVLSLAALIGWLRARGSASLTAEQRQGGDALAALVFVTGAVALGANSTHADRALWIGPLYVVTEASQRLCAVAHALVFALAALCCQALGARRLPWATLGAALLATGLSALQAVQYERPEIPERAPRLASLLRQGAGAYRREVEYFFSVAREAAARGCNPR